MKAFLSTVIVVLLSASLVAVAASPSQINFKARKKSLFHGPYKVYQVRCTDGSKGLISHWEKAKPWCIGTRRGRCFTSQLKAAAAVCK